MRLSRPPRTCVLAAALVAGLGGCATSDRASSDAGGDSAARADTADVLPGIEVLLRDSLHLVAGKRVGLITNHSGRDRAGTSSIDLLHRAPDVTLAALYAPEHGLRGVAEAGVKIASEVDSATGVQIHSLYGDTRVPTAEMLRDIDVLLYDIQDVGARVYTYEWTMVLSAEAAAKAGKPFVVLDRPNPIRADIVEGNILDSAYSSFVGLKPVALRYGMTPGELLRFVVGTGLVQADIAVVPLANYRRDMWWEDTGIPWVNPSPNLRDIDATLLYTGTVFFEGTNLSEGRGTDAPFKLVGAPWLTDAGAIAAELNALALPGVRFDSTSRTIAAGMKHAGLTIPMIQVTVTSRDSIVPVHVGAQMLKAIHARHAGDWEWRTSQFDRLAGTDALRMAILGGTVDSLMTDWDAQARTFAERRSPYLLYR